MANLFVAGQKHKPYAIIAATYPSGSICTCRCISDSSAKEPIQKQTDGKSVFIIPVGGDWAVKSEKDSKVAEKTIFNIQDQSVNNVTLSYSIPIYVKVSVYGSTNWVAAMISEYTDEEMTQVFATSDIYNYSTWNETARYKDIVSVTYVSWNGSAIFNWKVTNLLTGKSFNFESTIGNFTDYPSDTYFMSYDLE